MQDIRNDSLREHTIRQKILSEFERWEGVKYRFGGTTMNGIDCSSLMQKIFHSAFEDTLRKLLPRTTAQQLKQGVKTSRNNLKAGDLVFFRISSSLRHVGVYIGDDKFVHASTSKGVIISTLENDYWSERYKTARRIAL
ncbi:MAG: NlpC/P60 family protein [Serratia sp. (in: enterobacteria)]|uniref:NlpC/P60 family protein n=1 Tax=Serratia sp. (in: enterobacteria) TaxID=616 RepID=UPI003F31F6D9